MVYDHNDMSHAKEPLADELVDPAADLIPVISVAIDDVALASLARERDEQLACSVCDEPIEGRHSTGLLMWSRGDEIRFDEPPVCPACSSTIGVAAFYRWITASDEEM